MPHVQGIKKSGCHRDFGIKSYRTILKKLFNERWSNERRYWTSPGEKYLIQNKIKGSSLRSDTHIQGYSSFPQRKGITDTQPIGSTIRLSSQFMIVYSRCPLELSTDWRFQYGVSKYSRTTRESNLTRDQAITYNFFHVISLGICLRRGDQQLKERENLVRFPYSAELTLAERLYLAALSFALPSLINVQSLHSSVSGIRLLMLCV